jgi:hypothetical protein
MISLNTKCLTVFLGVVLIYLIWMDICLYMELLNLPIRLPAENLTTTYTFSPFHPMTVKLLMVSSFKEVGHSKYFKSFLCKSENFENKPSFIFGNNLEMLDLIYSFVYSIG